MSSYVYSKAIDLETSQSELADVPIGNERTRNVHAQRDIKNWFNAQLSTLEDRFAKYLELRY